MAKEKLIRKSFVMRLGVRAESIKAHFRGERKLGRGNRSQPPARASVSFAATTKTFPEGFPWLHHGVLSIPQRGEQTAGGKGRGLGSGVASTFCMSPSPRPGGSGVEWWFMLGPGRFFKPESDPGCAHNLVKR